MMRQRVFLCSLWFALAGATLAQQPSSLTHGGHPRLGAG